MSYVLKKTSMSFLDYPSIDGWCVNVYFVGCEHDCINCQNKNLSNIKSCDCISIDIDGLNEMLERETFKYKTKKVCFLGGDPLYKHNKQLLTDFLIKHGKKFEVCIYTGYEISYCEELTNFKFLKCGKYLEEYKQQSIKTDYEFVLGSKNQILYDSDRNILTKDGILIF